MNIHSYIQPRHVGKTTLAVYEYLKNPDSTLFIVPNKMMAYDTEKRFLLPKNTLITVNNILTKIRSKNFSKIIFDEYMFIEKRNEFIYPLISQLNDNGEVYIFSTPKRQYNKYLFDEIIKYKKEGKYSGDFLRDNKILLSNEKIKEEFNELWNDLLTHPNNKIHTEKLPFFKYPTRTKIDEYFNLLNNKQYELEILNNLYTEQI